MSVFLEDPSVLTKEKLKNELTANNVPLPSGEHKKEVYVQLYLKKLTVLNSKKSSPVDNFSSDDDELPAPVVSNRSRASGRKATRKTDKPRTEEIEVAALTDEGLKEELEKHGVEAGPIVASTRKVYEKKLQKVLDQPPSEAPSAPETTTELTADSNQNGNTNSDQYSDKEDDETPAPEPEHVPVVEKRVQSRGKTPVTLRTSSRRQNKAVEETPKKAGESVVEDILANEISTPTGISASCRRPIRGAAGRPVKPSDYWLDESLLKRSICTESHSFSESVSRVYGGTAPPSKAPVRQGVLSMLLRLLLTVVVAGSLFYAYQNVSAEHIDAVKVLLETVLTPLQGVVDSTATYLGISGNDVAQGADK